MIFHVQDERSLEDKILHHNPMREDASDEEQAKSDDEHESGSEPERTAIDEQLDRDKAEAAKRGPSARDFGRGADGLAPSLDFAGRSQRGGPKGVRDDYYMAMADLQRRREIQHLEKMEMLRKLGEGATMEGPSMAYGSAEAAAARAAVASGELPKEDPGSDGDDDDDDFMAAYRAKRMAELKKSAGLPKFGTVREIDPMDLPSEVDDVPSTVFVVVHLYETFNTACRAINAALPSVAKAFPGVKFIKLPATAASETFDPVALPTLVVYRNGEVAHTLIRVSDVVGEHPGKDDLEWLLCSVGVLESAAVKPVL